VQQKGVTWSDNREFQARVKEGRSRRERDSKLRRQIRRERSQESVIK
jgi:hypothetical protein